MNSLSHSSLYCSYVLQCVFTIFFLYVSLFLQKQKNTKSIKETLDTRSLFYRIESKQYNQFK